VIVPITSPSTTKANVLILISDIFYLLSNYSIG
jgi:hypothetical protein